jgi:hypothetical protein
MFTNEMFGWSAFRYVLALPEYQTDNLASWLLRVPQLWIEAWDLMARCLEYWLWRLKVKSMIMNRSRECVCECVGDVYDSGMFGVSEVLGEECGARVANIQTLYLRVLIHRGLQKKVELLYSQSIVSKMTGRSRFL